MKEIILLGGANGAGKTTAARVLLPRFFAHYPFLNADEIARRFAPADPEAAAFMAGRQMLAEMRAFVREGQSFTFETTCSGQTYLPMLKDCRADDWRITVYYFWLPSPEHSIDRVQKRVSQGGHSIPTDAIFRRFKTGLWNMRHLYLPLADSAAIYA